MNGSYTVRPGDTLSSTARKKACTLQALQAANPSLDPRRLKVGAALVIPDLRDKSAPDRPVDPKKTQKTPLQIHNLKKKAFMNSGES
jgi:LysM repeat protein